MLRIRFAHFLLLYAIIATVASVREVDYSKCGTEKGCVFLQGKKGSEGCGEYDPDSCTLSFTYAADPNKEKVAIELTVNTARGAKYAALGFSDDDILGRDYVVICDAENGNVTLAYNPGGNPPSGEERTPTQNLAEAATSVKVGKVEGKQIYVCRFKLATAVTEEFTEFKNISQKLRLYPAVDSTVSNDNAQMSLKLKKIGGRGKRPKRPPKARPTSRPKPPFRPRTTLRPKPPSRPRTTLRPKPPSKPNTTPRPRPATGKQPGPQLTTAKQPGVGRTTVVTNKGTGGIGNGDSGGIPDNNHPPLPPQSGIQNFPIPFPNSPPNVIGPHPLSPNVIRPHPPSPNVNINRNEPDDQPKTRPKDKTSTTKTVRDKAKSGSSAVLNAFLCFATLTALATSPLN